MAEVDEIQIADGIMMDSEVCRLPLTGRNSVGKFAVVSLVDFEEYFDENDRNNIPRILAIILRKYS